MQFKKSIVLTFFILALITGHGQSVGLVLSGGGAKGFAHIGVIKALEENNIPIDYIAGTSMGAIVGGLYAIGFTPHEMETLLNSDEFKKWSMGEIDLNDEYYYKLKNESPAWIEFPLQKIDGSITPKLPTNLIAPEQMDLRFMQYFEPAGAGVGYDFNKLFVPFFCMATDVHKNKALVLDSGNLSAAIRASMTFPGYFKPIEIDSVLLFDGGMENNFPTEIMVNKFHPDILIGSKVASNPEKPNQEDLYKQLENVFMKNTNYKMPENGFLIEPEVSEFGLLDLDGFDTLYLRGYQAAINTIDSIKKLIARRVDIAEVNSRRTEFKKLYKKIEIENIYITGADQGTADYILKNIRRNRPVITFKEFEQEYFKLLSDKLIQSVYPKVIFNNGTGYFDLYLDIKIKNEFSVSLGGNISSNLHNLGFAGIDYIFQKKNVYNLSSNFIIGQFYNSIAGKFRMDFPPRNIHGTRILSPFYIDISAATNSWEYFQITSDWFVDNESPTKLQQDETHFQSDFGRPIKNRGLLYMGFAYGQTADYYYHSNLVQREDVPDETLFDYSSIHFTYEHSTLNFREYADKGVFFRIQGRYVTGLENYTPGTTTGLANPWKYTLGHSWYALQMNYKHFFEINRYFTLGLHANFVYSNKKAFSNSMATLLSAYAFRPFPQSKLVFLENFRANSYVAAGMIPILNLTPSISLRAESYIFQPYQNILIKNYETTFSKAFPAPPIVSMLAAVYQSPLGPLALTACHFLHEETPFYFQLNFGYILFNKRGLD